MFISSETLESAGAGSGMQPCSSAPTPSSPPPPPPHPGGRSQLCREHYDFCSLLGALPQCSSASELGLTTSVTLNRKKPNKQEKDGDLGSGREGTLVHEALGGGPSDIS